MNEKEQCKELCEIIEEGLEEYGPHGEENVGRLTASDIYMRGYRKVPDGAVIMTTEERESLEKNVKDLQKVCVLRGEEIERLRAEIKRLRGEKQ